MFVFVYQTLEILEKFHEVEHFIMLLFSYISIASHLPEKFYSRTFSDALHKAKERNPERYCQLFGEPRMSFQVLDNPSAKSDYRDAGCK